MAFLFKLETEDGAPPEPATLARPLSLIGARGEPKIPLGRRGRLSRETVRVNWPDFSSLSATSLAASPC